MGRGSRQAARTSCTTSSPTSSTCSTASPTARRRSATTKRPTRDGSRCAPPPTTRSRAEGSPVLRPYAGTNPAEFFAVATEVFFNRPLEVREHEPALYAELARLLPPGPGRTARALLASTADADAPTKRPPEPRVPIVLGALASVFIGCSDFLGRYGTRRSNAITATSGAMLGGAVSALDRAGADPERVCTNATWCSAQPPVCSSASHWPCSTRRWPPRRRPLQVPSWRSAPP